MNYIKTGQISGLNRGQGSPKQGRLQGSLQVH
jgi:hypothetical protein